MNATVTRRALLRTSALAGFAGSLPFARAAAAPAAAPAASSVALSQLSPAVLSSVARVVGETTAKIHLRTAVRSDMVNAADAIELLRQHLLETPFHGTIMAMAKKASITEFDNAAIQRRVFEAVYRYDRAASIDEIQIPADLSAGVMELRAHGLDRGLIRIVHSLRAQSEKMPVAYWQKGDKVRFVRVTNEVVDHNMDKDRPWHLTRVQSQDEGSPDGLCEEAGFYLNFLAGGIGIVALFGCTPEPAAFMICPIIGLLAGILGLVSFAQWVVC